MKLLPTFLYCCCLITAGTIQTFEIEVSKPLTKQQLCEKLSLRDLFPRHVQSLNKERHKVTFDPETQNYTVRFSNELYLTQAFGINRQGTVCAWEAPTESPLWRALVVANLETGEKIPLTETHGQNLSQICINDVGDKIIAQDPTNIYIFCINNNTNNTQRIGRHTLQHQFCQKPRLLDISSNGTWVVSAAADDSVLLWEFQPTGYCKKKISVQGEKIIGSSFTKGDNLVLSTHSRILLFDLTKNQNAAHIFLTNRPLTDLSCTADKNNSLILTFQKDGKNQSVGATLIENEPTDSKKRACEE